jgi:hypothetical protein
MSACDEVAQLVKANNMIDRQTTRICFVLTRRPASVKDESQVWCIDLRRLILNSPNCRNRTRRMRRSARLTCWP